MTCQGYRKDVLRLNPRHQPATSLSWFLVGLVALSVAHLDPEDSKMGWEDIFPPRVIPWRVSDPFMSREPLYLISLRAQCQRSAPSYSKLVRTTYPCSVSKLGNLGVNAAITPAKFLSSSLLNG